MLNRRGFLKMLVLALPKLPFGLKSAIGSVIQVGVDDAGKSPPTQAVRIDTDGPAQRFWFRLQNSPLSELERKQAYLNWVLNQPNIVLIEQGELPVGRVFREFAVERNHKLVDGEWKPSISGIGRTILLSRHKFGDGEWTKWKPFGHTRSGRKIGGNRNRYAI